jgi:hypothetical protein
MDWRTKLHPRRRHDASLRFADSRSLFADIVEITAVGHALVKLMAVLWGRLLLRHQKAHPETIVYISNA